MRTRLGPSFAARLEGFCSILAVIYIKQTSIELHGPYISFLNTVEMLAIRKMGIFPSSNS
jgi:hypothetical protein